MHFGWVTNDEQSIKDWQHGLLKQDDDIDYDHCYLASVVEQEVLEPLSVQEALRGPQKEQWKGAMEEELKSLLENQTWSLVEKPVGHRILGTKWIFRVKRNADQSIAKFKARLVVKGYLQEKDIDYKETFAPVFKYQSLRI